mgnify:CR=1 FL=1
MANYESKLEKPGVVVYRIKGELDLDNVEAWRKHLVDFIKDNRERGACGILLDVCGVETISTDGIDAIMELLSDPEEIIGSTRTRFALIGVRPFAQRFLRSVMPLTPISHIRARFFHEVAEGEAVAWLSAMVDSADDLPAAQPKPAAIEKPDKTNKATKPAEPAEKPIKPDGKAQPARRLFGRDEVPHKGGSAAEAKQKLTQQSAPQKTKDKSQKPAP